MGGWGGLTAFIYGENKKSRWIRPLDEVIFRQDPYPPRIAYETEAPL
jgi:hypothetical protein